MRRGSAGSICALYRLRFWLLVVAAVCFVALWAGPMLAAPGVSAPSADLLARCDGLYAKRADLDNVRQAMKLLQSYADDGAYEALWREARCTYWLGQRSVGKDARLPLFEKGKEIAQKAEAVDDTKPDAHYWVASCIGKAGLERGVLNSLFSVKPMKAELDKVLAIDPNYSDAHRVLAELYTKVPGWPLSIGDSKKAVEHAELALKAKPKDIRYLRVAAEAYLSNKEKSKAKVSIELLLKQPLSVEEPEDDQVDKDWATSELKKL